MALLVPRISPSSSTSPLLRGELPSACFIRRPNRLKLRRSPSGVRASWQELAGVLIFSAIPFTAVKAVANSSLGERLRQRMEATKKAAVESSARFQSLAKKAREESIWYGKGRPRWLGPIPYDYPSYLTGELPGDYGFDLAGLGKDPVAFQKYFNFEILHARWAMLASLGVIVPELLDQFGVVHFIEPVWWKVGYAKLQGDTLDYLGIPGFHIAGSQGVIVIAICQALLMAYIIYMGSRSIDDPDEVLRQNHQMLAAVHGGSIEKAQASHIYSYSNGFRGLAAKLTEEQASKMAEMPGVVSVFPNKKRILHTTHSWDFMGLAADEAMEIPGFSTKNQENVIIGFIDTGIWPESPSFNDVGMPPVPSRWKGDCQGGEPPSNFTCNKKIIGARYYLRGYEAEEESKGLTSDSDITVNFKSPRDSSGHGSHTASTAAGRYVMNMNYNGLAAGGARGGVPMARIAVYKTCWDSGCFDADLLAAFDDAIKDGVDILSVSLGPESPQGDYFSDAISIGSFHAHSHGILVVSSVGNEGTRGSATNLAPWMLTVAASSTDRDFATHVLLGDGTSLVGESLDTFQMNRSARTISASEANAGYFTPYQSSFCLDSSLNRTKASGKILICRHIDSSSESRVAKSLVVKNAGGVGMILINELEDNVAIPFAIPAASVGRVAGDKILSFVNHTRRPRSLILPTKTVFGSRPAPRVAAFSSRGPNSLTPEILKPDIMAPGLNILAAWSPAKQNINFNILSGTSMSCPHVTGLVALIKAVHPSWSPSAIKSAIMTTATILDKNGNVITADPEGHAGTPFDYGSGFPDPKRALDPGLIYNAEPEDYKAFLCSIGYDDKSLQLVTGDNSVCTKPAPAASNLNYPSITIPDLKGSYSVTRTVTNVGEPRSIYHAILSHPAGINVTVVPKVLVFERYGQKMNFTVKFRVAAPSKGYVFGSLSWKAEKIQVTSPLVVRVQSSDTGLS